LEINGAVSERFAPADGKGYFREDGFGDSVRKNCFALVWMLPTVLALGCLMSPPISADDAFSAAVKSLNTRSFAEKSSAATLIAGMTHPRASVVLEAMLTGNLYTKRRSDIVVIASALDQGGYRLVDAISGEALGDVGRRGAKKISVNNGLRKRLRGLIAGRQLSHADFQDRIEAVEAIVVSGDIQLRPLLVGRRQLEQEVAVLEAIDIALVIFDLDVGDGAVRLAAIKASANNLHPTVRTKLTNIASDQLLDQEIRGAASEALLELEALANQYQMVETFFFGLSLGSIMVLAAIGLSITFGVMGVINMAHGELIMIGAYTTYVVQILFPDIIEYSLLIAVPAAFCVSGIVGIMIERSVIQFLYGRPLETLLATFGVSLILQQTVRSLFSPLNRAVSTPEWMSGSLEIAQGLSITYNRLYIFFFALLVFAALLLILQRTRLGLEVRAVTQNRSMAKAMGIRSARVDIMTFGLGAGIAGVAGVALSQLTNVGPNLGQGYIVDSFMVVVFGGVGNLWGTLVAGLSLGVVNKFIEPVAGAVVAKILVLIFIILFIQKRPRGLFPQKGRAVED
jgi:urea transport system permease protein